MKRKTIFTSVMALLFAGSAMAQTNATEIKSGGFYRLYSAEKGKTLYGWHISDLKIYDNPKECSEFRKPCDRFLDCCTCRRLVHNEYMSCDNKITRPPLSWCYVEDLGEEE